MAEYSNLSATINAQIRANGVQAITGPVLNAVLTAMVNVLGDGYRLNGVAVPADNPGSPDNRVAYLAAQDGTYTNFGGLTISGEVALLLWDSAWTKEVLFSIDTAVTPGSGNLVTSGAVDDALTTLAGNIAAAYMQLVPGATEGNLAEFDNAGQVRDAGLATSDLATKDGHYPDLFAGYAGNLVDTRSAGTRQGPFAFRQSGGDGVNYMRKILGRTEAWNQLIQNGDFATNVNSWSAVRGTITNENGRCKYVLNELTSGTAVNRIQQDLGIISGHTYYCAMDIELPKAATARIENNGAGIVIEAVCTAGKNRVAGVVTATANENFLFFGINDSAGAGYALNDVIYFDNIVLVDLTLEGLGLTTADQFRALHPLPYYNYNAGVLKNNAATGLETTGFNQWDEEQMGAWPGIARVGDGWSGLLTAFYQRHCFDNLINYTGKIFIRINYSLNEGRGFLSAIYTDGTFTDFRLDPAERNTLSFETTEGKTVKHIEFSYGTNGTFTVHSLCINLSDASRNGTYEPYWKRDIVLGLTGVTGIPEGGTGADRVTIFPNGLAGVGTAQDMFYVENGVTKAKKRAGSVDLGNLNWSYGSYSGAYYFEAGISGLVSGNSFGISSKYVRDTQHDDVISMVDNSFILVNGYIYVKDSTYNDAGTFKTAMSGVKLCYELATPVVYTDLQNADGTPFVFPKMVEVDNLGTEKRLPEDTADNPQGPFESVSNYSISTANLVRLLNL